MIEYLESISIGDVDCIDEDFLDRDEEEVVFLSIDYVEPENIKEYELLMKTQDLNQKKYLLGQSAFERGAGDYHQIIVFVLEGIALGALSEFGRRTFEKMLNQFRDYQNASTIKFKPVIAINYVSANSGINKQDLRLTKISSSNDTELEIKVTSRYKDFIMTYDNESNSFIHFEEKDKTQAMI